MRPESEQIFYNAYSDEGNRSYMLRSGIREESKKPKSCLMAKQRAGQLAYAQTIPAHRLTTPLRLLRSSDRFLQRRMSLLPLPQKIYLNRPLRFLRILRRKCYCLNGLTNVEVARHEGYRHRKSVRPRLTSGSYIFINFCLVKLRKQPHFEKNSAGMEDGEGRLRKGISET